MDYLEYAYLQSSQDHEAQGVVDELLALGLPNIEIGQTGVEYQF